MPSIIDNANKLLNIAQPLASGGSIIKKAQELQGIVGPQISTPQMNTPEQMESKMQETEQTQLPFGATGWNPDGSANYGEGLNGWWKGITSRVYAPVTETINKENVTREATGLETVMRAEGEAFTQLINAVSYPQQTYYKYLADRRSYEMYADMVNPNSPDIYNDNEFGNFLRLTSSIIPGISNLTTMYEKDRITNGNRMLPDGTFEKIKEANRIWNEDNVGVGIFDTQAQSEYVRRVMAGEDPYKVSKTYSKPVENFIADFILDPLNIFDGLGIANKLLGKGVSVGAKISEKFIQDADVFQKAAKAATKLGDDVFTQTAEKILLHNAEAGGKVFDIKGGLFDLTQDSLQVNLMDKLNGILGPAIRFANGDGAKLNNIMEAVWKLGSENIDEVQDGMKLLQDNKILHLFLSDNAFESARFMTKVGEKSNKFQKLLDLGQIADKKTYMAEMEKLIRPILDDMYPDIAKIADKQAEIAKIRALNPDAELPDILAKYDKFKLSPVNAWLAKKHRAIQNNWFGTKVGVRNLNEFFATIYLTSPGFTVRNYLNAAATAFIDLGPKALRELTDFSGGGYKYLEDMFGFVPGSIAKSFSMVQEAGKVGKSRGIGKYFDFMRGLANKGEEFESVAIAANAGKRFASDMLQEGRFIESMDSLRSTKGFSEDALKFLEKKVRQFNGNTTKAMEEFTKAFNSGQIEHFREPEVIFSKELLADIHPNLIDELRDVLKSGTLDEVLGKVDNIFNSMMENMTSTVDDIVPDYTDPASQKFINMLNDFSLSDDGIDQFAKKVNVRRALSQAIDGTSLEILDKKAYKALRPQLLKIESDIHNFQGLFSTNVREIVTNLRNHSKSVEDIIKELETNADFADMAKFVAPVTKQMDRDTAIDIIWTYYKRTMEDKWVTSAKQQYDLLMDALKGKTLSKTQLNFLENLKLKFITDYKYLNASKIANGKALINEPYFWYKLGDRINSVYARARQLGLFRSSTQKGGQIGKAIPYKSTVFDVVNTYLKELGIDKIGDLHIEKNYRQAMEILDDFAVRKEKLRELLVSLRVNKKDLMDKGLDVGDIDEALRMANSMLKDYDIIGMKNITDNLDFWLKSYNVPDETAKAISEHIKKIKAESITDLIENRTKITARNLEEAITQHNTWDEDYVQSLIRSMDGVTKEDFIEARKAFIVEPHIIEKYVNAAPPKMREQVRYVAHIFDRYGIAPEKIHYSETRKQWKALKEHENVMGFFWMVNYGEIWINAFDYNYKSPNYIRDLGTMVHEAFHHVFRTREKFINEYKNGKAIATAREKQILDELIPLQEKIFQNRHSYFVSDYANSFLKNKTSSWVTETLSETARILQYNPHSIDPDIIRLHDLYADLASGKPFDSIEASRRFLTQKNNYLEDRILTLGAMKDNLAKELDDLGAERRSISEQREEYLKLNPNLSWTDIDPVLDKFRVDISEAAIRVNAKREELNKAYLVWQRAVEDKKEELNKFTQKIGNPFYVTADDYLEAIDNIPVMDDGNIPDYAKVLRENYAGTKRMFDNIKSTIRSTYGKVEQVSNLSKENASALNEWARLNESKMLDFRMRAMEHMKNVRDFALLDYAGGKKNIDLALAYMFPYQFWYSRSYANWTKRLVSNPAIINRYANFREKMAEANKNLPKYMQNYVVLGKSFGLEKNPLMLNLEASLNPLNGLTGVDFEDKNKIVGTPGTLEYGWTKTLDSIGKFGPSPWTPINVATAGALFAKGEKEAAARWAGRLFPQSYPIKAVASIFNKNLELDPFVLLFGGWESKTDPYESRRVGRALVALSEAGKITKEQAYEAARLKSGDVWNQAVVQATKNRSLGTISSYVLGQGFKIRSSTEAEIDKFYEEYFKMWANADKFSPDEMSNYQRYIRTKYNFADLVILSGKGSAERDKSYAYSVLSRIAPGNSTEILTALGVNPKLSDLFYESKGDMSNWNALDKENFMNAMVQIGTLVAIPKDTTASEWQNVKTIYKQVDKDLATKFGDDIITKIETYYEFTYDSMEQKNYLEAHPEVASAMDYKDLLIATNKEIAPYYDGLNRMERYYDGEFRRNVAKMVDPNYYDYYKVRSLIIDPAELKRFDSEVGWSAINKKYYAFKKEWDLYVFKQLDKYDGFFGGETIPTAMQGGVNMSVGQQAISQLLAPAKEQERAVTWQQITSVIPMPITLERALEQYMTTDRQFSTTENTMVTKLLNNVNETYGLNLTKDDLLSLAMDYYNK
jgi:hypothetical protein